ncbi:hypothetical protein BaRGS_00033066 [Batillaria attramentaria]|uniref:Uncharacterized protein n=1 Tax=Batillaria attramentaria TaxID=370345 RepID=A0ABD0JLR3_9CAEN
MCPSRLQTPRGHKPPSSRFVDGIFYLSLPNPVRGERVLLPSRQSVCRSFQMSGKQRRPSQGCLRACQWNEISFPRAGNQSLPHEKAAGATDFFRFRDEG